MHWPVLIIWVDVVLWWCIFPRKFAIDQITTNHLCVSQEMGANHIHPQKIRKRAFHSHKFSQFRVYSSNRILWECAALLWSGWKLYLMNVGAKWTGKEKEHRHRALLLCFALFSQKVEVCTSPHIITLPQVPGCALTLAYVSASQIIHVAVQPWMCCQETSSQQGCLIKGFQRVTSDNLSLWQELQKAGVACLLFHNSSQFCCSFREVLQGGACM